MIELDLLELFTQTQSWTLVFLSVIVTVGTCFGGIWFTHFLSKKSYSKKAKNAEKLLKVVTQRNERIVKTLKDIVAELDVDRAYIYEFHNGSFYTSGLPMEKFSCTYEVVREGISAECPHHIEYKMSNYSEYIYKIVHKGIVEIDNVEEYTEEPLLRNLLTSKGVKSMVNVALKNPYDQTIGFLGVDFVTHTKSLNKREVNDLQNFARILLGYVEMEK